MNTKLSPPTLYKGFITLMAVTALLPLPHQITFPYTLTGIIPLFIGSYIAISTKRMFKRTHTPVNHRARPLILHASGIFRFTRNPMYLGISVGLVGVAVMIGIIYDMVFALVYLVVMDLLFVRPEEQQLEEEFGDLFKEYKAKTRRWL